MFGIGRDEGVVRNRDRVVSIARSYLGWLDRVSRWPAIAIRSRGVSSSSRGASVVNNDSGATSVGSLKTVLPHVPSGLTYVYGPDGTGQRPVSTTPRLMR